MRLVPGPADPGGAGLLPRPPLPKFLTAPFEAALKAAAPLVRFASCSNPVRVKHLSQEIVLMREDVVVRTCALPVACRLCSSSLRVP